MEPTGPTTRHLPRLLGAMHGALLPRALPGLAFWLVLGLVVFARA
jgi:hypothetical protein